MTNFKHSVSFMTNRRSEVEQQDSGKMMPSMNRRASVTSRTAKKFECYGNNRYVGPFFTCA